MASSAHAPLYLCIEIIVLKYEDDSIIIFFSIKVRAKTIAVGEKSTLNVVMPITGKSG